LIHNYTQAARKPEHAIAQGTEWFQPSSRAPYSSNNLLFSYVLSALQIVILPKVFVNEDLHFLLYPSNSHMRFPPKHLNVTTHSTS
jgi:hypothetical protein